MNAPAIQLKLSDVVAEYDAKAAAIPAAIEAFEAAGTAIKTAVTIGGVWGDGRMDTGHVYEREMRLQLLKSAWKHVYAGLQIERLSSPDDKRRFQQAMDNPAPFTLDNIVATFEGFVTNPRGNILRGLAEVFCQLDPVYKSHDKMRIGVKGLPKRIIIGHVDDYGSYGKDKIESVINALAALQNKPLVTWREINALLKQEDALLNAGTLPGDRTWSAPIEIVGRGISLRRFANKNGHMYFTQQTLLDVNRALAEFYGEVLPDAAGEKPTKPRPGTSVAKDLQYYPTPVKVADRLIEKIYHLKGKRLLDPSCGCGRLLDAARRAGAQTIGIEFDASRAAQASAKGHPVVIKNFLECAPPLEKDQFDIVLMNPPFYGKHYEKHVRHALRFLKPGGTLTAVLPVTARYDHGLLEDLGGSWDDLPVGSFSESGTNINTTVLTAHRREV